MSSFLVPSVCLPSLGPHFSSLLKRKCICDVCIICSSTEGHLARFSFLAIVDRAAMSVAGQVLADWDAEFFGQRQRSGIAASDLKQLIWGE